MDTDLSRLHRCLDLNQAAGPHRQTGISLRNDSQVRSSALTVPLAHLSR